MQTRMCNIHRWQYAYREKITVLRKFKMSRFKTAHKLNGHCSKPQIRFLIYINFDFHMDDTSTHLISHSVIFVSFVIFFTLFLSLDLFSSNGKLSTGCH